MPAFTPFISDAEIIAIGHGLRNRTLPKLQWTHAAHFASALWLLAHHPEIDACTAMPVLIRTYNETIGVANTDSSGYHETITQASLRAARSFLAERTAQSLYVTCNELMSSPLGNTHWLLGYWSQSVLFSVEARRAWVEPDIQPLPF
jgi:hypothetical protein